MSNEIRDRLVSSLAIIRDDLDWLFDDVDNGGPVRARDASEKISEMAQEIIWEKGEPFAVVLATGGPRIEVVGGGRQGDYRLVGRMGTETVELRGPSITRFGEHYREICIEDDEFDE